MAESNICIQREILECPICFCPLNQTVRIPRNLPCGHYMCSECLQTFIRSSGGKVVACPSCRNEITVPENGVEGFIVNRFAIEVIQNIEQNGCVDGNELICCGLDSPYHSSDRQTTVQDNYDEVRKGLSQTLEVNDQILLRCDQEISRLDMLSSSLHKQSVEAEQEISENSEKLIDMQKQGEIMKQHIQSFEKRKQRELHLIRSEIQTGKEEMSHLMNCLETVSVKKHKLSNPEEKGIVQQQTNKLKKCADRLLSTANKINDKEYQVRLTIRQDLKQLLNGNFSVGNLHLGRIPDQCSGCQEDGQQKIKLTYRMEYYSSHVTNTIRKPFGITRSSTGDFIVSDLDTGRLCIVKQYDQNSSKKHDLEKTINIKIRATGVCCDQHDNIIITDNSSGHVLKLTQGFFKHWYSQVLTKERMDHPRGITIDENNRIIVCDRKGVHVLNEQGICVQFISTGYSSKLSDPFCALFYDKYFIVSDFGSDDCIKVLDQSGQFVRAIGRRGVMLGELYGPRSLAADKHGNVFVCDSGNHRVQIFSVEGNFIGKFGSRCPGNEQLLNPAFLDVSFDGIASVCDSDNGIIKSFRKV